MNAAISGRLSVQSHTRGEGDARLQNGAKSRHLVVQRAVEVQEDGSKGHAMPDVPGFVCAARTIAEGQT